MAAAIIAGQAAAIACALAMFALPASPPAVGGERPYSARTRDSAR